MNRVDLLKIIDEDICKKRADFVKAQTALELRRSDREVILMHLSPTEKEEYYKGLGKA